MLAGLLRLYLNVLAGGLADNLCYWVPSNKLKRNISERNNLIGLKILIYAQPTESGPRVRNGQCVFLKARSSRTLKLSEQVRRVRRSEGIRDAAPCREHFLYGLNLKRSFLPQATLTATSCRKKNYAYICTIGSR
ncbi:hypothetical protein NDU88_001242 [Pleurodeles waltl]|uniref:Secreted protein n=1 Tax=Pleurodeles waltl TaxID=8319 RepID=A0AAV7V980_PLEWA|nr:hypothetical protein NDU88_001242 [Pleurodeles waltl]